eukprot:Hpha_TRINITY_DN16176_c0_g3::TRINITY_DN16176_c0_g3_i1::g.5006::m.5006/K07937/ARF1; ADP-ribosylation factor 1
MGNSFGGKQDQQWFEEEFLMPMGCAGPGSCCADAVGVTYKVLMVGLDGAGKTSICLKLMDRGNEIPIRTGTQPAIYDNKMTKERFSNWIVHLGGDDVTMEICDVGGRAQHRPQWAYMLRGTTAVVFVVDGGDRERLMEAGNTLFEQVLPHVEAGQLPLLILANDKQGSDRLTEAEILAGMGITNPGLPLNPTGSIGSPGDIPKDQVDLIATAVAAAVTLLYFAQGNVRELDLKRILMMGEVRHHLLPPPERFLFSRCSSEDSAGLWKIINELRKRIENNIDRLTLT